MRFLWIFFALSLLPLPLEIHAVVSSDDPPCPEGMEAKVIGLQVTCVSQGTSQKTGSSQPIDEIQLTDEQWAYVGIGIVIFIIIIAVVVKASQSNSEPELYKDVERKDFTFATKERVKALQKGRCAECERYPTHWEFDHINGRGDNSIENCQGLCRDCHQDKTLKDNY